MQLWGRDRSASVGGDSSETPRLSRGYSRVIQKVCRLRQRVAGSCLSLEWKTSRLRSSPLTTQGFPELLPVTHTHLLNPSTSATDMNVNVELMPPTVLRRINRLNHLGCCHLPGYINGAREVSPASATVLMSGPAERLAMWVTTVGELKEINTMLSNTK